MAGEFWFSDQQWAVIEPLLPKNQPGARRVDDRRILSGIVHVLRSGSRWEGLPGDLRAADHDLQSLPSLVAARPVAETPGRARSCRAGRYPSSRQHQRQSPSLGFGRKRGAAAQAIGRSRGGPTTKIHAVVDGQGRPLAFVLTAGQKGDSPVAPELLANLPSAELCIADAAYDSDALRQQLLARGTRPVIPNNPTRKRRHPFDPQATSIAT
jgi:transposase